MLAKIGNSVQPGSPQKGGIGARPLFFHPFGGRLSAEKRTFAPDMYNKHLPLTIILLCLCLRLTAYNDHRNARVDSLERALGSPRPPRGKELLRAYDELMRGYLPYDAAKAAHYGRKALALSYELNGLLIRQYTLRHFGLLCYGREDYDAALSYFNHALAVTDTMARSGRYTQLELDDARSALYGSIANVYNEQGKSHLAIHYYQRALPLFERNNWLESQAVLYHNIGELYLSMGNRAEAKRNYLLAIEKGEAAPDSLMAAMARKGLAKVYIDDNDYQKADATIRACYAYYRAHRCDEPQDYAAVLATLAQVELMHDFTVAKSYADSAAALITPDMPFDIRSAISQACCQVAMAEGRWRQALAYAQQAAHPDSLATLSDVDSYRLLAEIYTELGEKAKARECLRKMYDLMTRYATGHYQSGLSQMEVLYETEKKEARIAALDHERTLYRWLLAAATVAIAAMVAGGFLTAKARRRKKALRDAQVALDAETKERRILAQDLHDGLGGLLSLLRLKLTRQDEALSLLDAIQAELRRTAHHLMPEELLRNGLDTALRDFALSVPGARFHTSRYERLDKDAELVLYRCAYELVNNVLKHAQARHINIQLMQHHDETTLTVSDDGRGMSAPEGMGLQNIRRRIAPYRGQLRIATAEGRGTDINITITQKP